MSCEVICSIINLSNLQFSLQFNSIQSSIQSTIQVCHPLKMENIIIFFNK